MFPPSVEYVQELHARWTDTRAFSRQMAGPWFGLGHMLPVKSGIAFVIVPPYEALRPVVRDHSAVSRTICSECLRLACPIGPDRELTVPSAVGPVPLFHWTGLGLVDASLMKLELGCTLSTLVPFHILTNKEVLQAISPGNWFTSVNLTDASVRFVIQGRHFQFRVFLFGLSFSPRVFTLCVPV
ncbi:hypothetical protein XENORESO_007602 [Xenotaenia resolanae]|uniref:Uncharacterized protein n=1 Tax=Xenotaenia resolanae TaxID=208358 RepID=A0ABV0X7E2_9TELE